MTTAGVAQKTVLETIFAWSVDRPSWQRDTLRRIVVKGKFDDDDLRSYQAAEAGVSE